MNKSDYIRIDGEMAVVRNIDSTDCIMIEMRDGSEVWITWDDEKEIWTRDETGEEVEVVA